MQGSQGGRSRLWPGEGKNRKRSVGLEARVLRERVEYDVGKAGKVSYSTESRINCGLF